MSKKYCGCFSELMRPKKPTTLLGLGRFQSKRGPSGSPNLLVSTALGITMMGRPCAQEMGWKSFMQPKLTHFTARK